MRGKRRTRHWARWRACRHALRVLPWSIGLVSLAPWAQVGADGALFDAEPAVVIENPTPQAFSVCYNHGCSKAARTGLTPGEWDRLAQIFRPPATDPGQERARLARAVALMETLVGERTGTAGDRGGNLKGIFAFSPQQDCIDESTNSTTYLRLMEDAGLLRWHRVEKIRTRGFVIFGFPHNTAVVRDLTTGREYAVDSWFFDNGVEPVVLPLEVWSHGWHPGDALDSGPATEPGREANE